MDVVEMKIYQNQIGDTILVMKIRFMLMYLNNL
ncbi:Uncharacterised protein [Streptococcus pneumoniae]|nr:Uncharacterised protein [Streptococcus pneumoniae]